MLLSLPPQELDNTEVRTPECLSWTTKTENKTPPTKNNKTESGRGKDYAKKTKPKPPQPTEEDNIKRREEYLCILKGFVTSSSLVYTFPANLNSYERRLIHQLCEELSLHHCSQGEGKDRHIVVRKSTAEEQETVQSKEEEKKKEEEEEEEEDKEPVLTPGELLAVEIQVMIETFIDSAEDTKVLPGKMSAFERGVVRDVCEERGILHHTEGEGKRRHIVIQKPPQKNKNKNTNEHGNQKKTEDTATPAKVTQHTNGLLPTPQDTATAPNDTHSHSNGHSGTIPKIKQENCAAVSVKKARMRFVDGQYVAVEEGSSSTTQVKRCAVCGKDVLLQNYSLHSMQCERRNREDQQNTAATGKNVRICML